MLYYKILAHFPLQHNVSKDTLFEKPQSELHTGMLSTIKPLIVVNSSTKVRKPAVGDGSYSETWQKRSGCPRKLTFMQVGLLVFNLIQINTSVIPNCSKIIEDAKQRCF